MSWPLVKLIELVDINIGRTPSRSNDAYWGKGYPWLSIADMSQGSNLKKTKEQITSLAVNDTMPNLAPKGTVLFSFKLSIGKVGVANVDMYHNEAIASFPIKNVERICTEYLVYALKKLDYLASTDRAVMGATLNKKKLSELMIPLPPLAVQKQIAAVLEKADTLRSQCQQMEQELNALAQSVFLDMFGDFRKMDKTGFLPLGDCADVCSGITKGQKFGDKPTVIVPYMRVANVQDGYLDLNEVKNIEAKISDFDKYLLQAGDVLMTEGGDHDKLGRGAVWNGKIENCIHQNHVFRVRLHCHFLPKFFEYLLQSQYAKQYFLKCAKKTTNLASINITQ